MSLAGRPSIVRERTCQRQDGLDMLNLRKHKVRPGIDIIVEA
jgi:hypothetical protein